MEFNCGYDKEMDLSSEEFEVSDKKGVFEGIGELNGGFELTIGNANHASKSILFGQMVRVTAKWVLDTLPDVNFYFKQCTLRHGDGSERYLIYDFCYSNRFLAGPVEVGGNAIAMEYMAFMPKNLIGVDDQRIDCIIEVCMEDCPKKNEISCPTGQMNQIYLFEAKGFN